MSLTHNLGMKATDSLYLIYVHICSLESGINTGKVNNNMATAEWWCTQIRIAPFLFYRSKDRRQVKRNDLVIWVRGVLETDSLCLG